MIKCPRCEISFSPSYEACPQCNEFKTPPEARKAYFLANARDRLDDGDAPETVRADLVSSGFSNREADEFLRRELASIARQNRGIGFVRLSIGITMVCFGVVCIVCTLLTLRKDSPVRLDGRGFGYLLIGGIVLVGAGLLAIVSGGLTTLTGKELGIGPPEARSLDDEIYDS